MGNRYTRIAGSRQSMQRKYLFFFFFPGVLEKSPLNSERVYLCTQNCKTGSLLVFTTRSPIILIISLQATVLALFLRAVEDTFLLCIVNMGDILQSHIFI